MYVRSILMVVIRKKRYMRTWLVLAGICLLATACLGPAPVSRTAEPQVQHTPTASETPLPVPTTTPLLGPTATPETVRVWLPDFLPEKLVSDLSLPGGVDRAESETGANTWIKVKAEGVDGEPLAEWAYALVAPFPTVTDEVTLEEIYLAWQGKPAADLPFDGLLVDGKTRSAFEKVWGPAAPFVKTTAQDQLVDLAWAAKTRWTLVPFERLEPRWKVIVVNGQSPIRKGFDLKQYGLKLEFVLQGDSQHTAAVVPQVVYRNYDPQKLTTVMLTGVTALVRGTAALMEVNGMDYPAEFIGDTLHEADILHISNEVPFWKTCPEPYFWEGLSFCSRTKYIQLLEDIGTDVVDLAGDHFKDWGPEAMLFTIDLYKERGWLYYGGGANIKEAQSAARFEHNGNKIAFLGCNAKPVGYAGASETSPGAVHCDFDQLTAEIQRQREDGYLPIVTFQHLEYYSYNAHPILQADFKKVADAGAVIVSGSQAHQPHAMTFEIDGKQEESFLHYGLGNLFFDQEVFGLETSQAFIDRHVIYDGRYISTELLTIMFVDNARARFMTPEEREFLLTTIFKASGWE